MKKTFAIILAMILLLTGTVLCAQAEAADTGEKYTIGYVVKNMQESYCIWLASQLELQVAENYNDIFDYVIVDGKGDVATQIQCVENYISREVDIIVIEAVDPDPLVDVIARAADAGIHTIVTNCGWSDEYDTSTSCVISSNYGIGEIMAEYIASAVPADAKICVVKGEAGNVGGEDRYNGFHDKISELAPGIELLDVQHADWDTNRAMSITEDWLVAYDQIDAVVACNDNMGMGALEAVEKSGRQDEILVTGVDAIWGACVAIQDNRLDMTVLQNAGEAVENILRISKEYLVDDLGMQRVSLPGTLVTKDNIDEMLTMLEKQGMAE